MATATYVTLVPVTYIEEGKVRQVTKAGVRIQLDEIQAAALDGSISYVSGGLQIEDLPRTVTLRYPSLSEFPINGDDNYLYLAEDTGLLYSWDAAAIDYETVSQDDITSDVISDATPTGKALLTAADIAAARAVIETLGLVQAAKNPDLLVTGAVTVDGNDLITSAAVAWPDGTVGTLTITSRDANDAVLAYNITYGSPVTKTYTQPAITRNANGAATNVPAIVVT